ncbi:hypothetical protein FRC10_005065 [Ceratobasidium sp. 414]|nr:hypothetical protein FRC10_005065 [Ceratobasidium sp. 414]
MLLGGLMLMLNLKQSFSAILDISGSDDQLLNFTIEVDNEPEFVEQLQTFFNENSKVTVLYVSTKNKNSWFAPLCKGLNQSLARLTLEDCDFADPDLAQFVNVEFRIRGYSLWTHLVKLELIRCVVDIALLEGMTANISMQELALVECEVRSPNSGVCSQLSLSMFTPQYVDRLRTTIKNHGDV